MLPGARREHVVGGRAEPGREPQFREPLRHRTADRHVALGPVGLRLGEVRLADALTHQHAPAVEVHVRPREPDEFPDAESRLGGERDHRVLPPVEAGEELHELVTVEGLHLFVVVHLVLLRNGEANTRGGVRPDQPVLVRRGEEGLHRGDVAAHRGGGGAGLHDARRIGLDVRGREARELPPAEPVHRPLQVPLVLLDGHRADTAPGAAGVERRPLLRVLVERDLGVGAVLAALNVGVELRLHPPGLRERAGGPLPLLALGVPVPDDVLVTALVDPGRGGLAECARVGRHPLVLPRNGACGPTIAELTAE